jgi:hypothetical protein
LLTSVQRTNVPDPTADLNWCDWKGAITNKFSENARRFPQRPCVLQSIPAAHLDDPQERRCFSYRTILRASNIVAHHLISGGVKSGDIVMIYAHRSVDLVVAVMGTLKAGAAFSVIGKCRTSSKLAGHQVILCRSRIPSLAPKYLPPGRTTPWVNCPQRCGNDQPDCPSFHSFRTSSLRRSTCAGTLRRWYRRWGTW